jgi:hypothetical protein
VIDLGVLPGQTSSAPSDINNALHVVGLSGDQAFEWDPVNGLRALGLTATRPPQINNSGIIAGVRASGGQSHVVALVNGVEYVLPSPPDSISEVRELTDNNLLLLGGSRSWAMVNGEFFDLTAAFGGGAFAINERGMVGGANANGAYLRLSDGRVIQPWPTAEPVRLIGPAGHFAGLGFFGDPAGNVSATPLVRECNLTSARAINDGGYIAGVAQFSNNAQRAVLLVPIAPSPPTGLTFRSSGRTVTLAWEASSGALDYILEAGRLPGASDLFNGSVGETTTLTVTVAAGRYYVRVRARNAAGVSAPTADVIIDVP